jgi:hypothetical protein
MSRWFPNFRQVSAIAVTVLALALLRAPLSSQDSSSSQSSSRSHSSRPQQQDAGPDAGSISNGVYRNLEFGFTCKIPAGWVLRTDEMNNQELNDEKEDAGKGAAKGAAKGGRVLLATFSRPPEARAGDVNSSILIAAESTSVYPGLKDAAQYFGPITEVAKAQGFNVEEELYEFAVGAKTLVRGDFEKDVGSRAMHQSTLVMLAHGYAVSFTFIGGTEDEVEELVSGLSFSATGKTTK